MTWSDSVVVVTGATRGIGRSLVGRLAGLGARVGCVARSESDLGELARELGPSVVSVAAADVGDRQALRAALGELTAALGPLDVLVNNAGVGLFGAVAELDPADAERLIRSNYLSVVYATTEVLPSMIERRRGHIVNVGSIAGLVASPLEAAYSASKFAVTGFTEALAVEVAPYGIAVTMVHPGPVATTFFDRRGHPYSRTRPKPLRPEAVADAVIRAVETGRVQQVLPRWLAVAPVVRSIVPKLYRRGVQASFRAELGKTRTAGGPPR